MHLLRNPALAADRYEMLFTVLALIKSVLHQLRQIGRDRDDSLLVAGVMLRFGASYRQAVSFPIHVRPGQQVRFRGHSQAGATGQAEEQAPFGIGACGRGVLPAYSLPDLSLLVALGTACPSRQYS